MTKKSYTESEIKQLKCNPNIVEVNKSSITYLHEFKIKAVMSNLEGKFLLSIFIEHDVDLDNMGKDMPRKRLYTWRTIYDESGELGLLVDSRGKNRSEKVSKQLSVEEKLKKAEAKINFLEMEN